jgi:crossover junction endodeoxyribonuclease RuvC
MPEDGLAKMTSRRILGLDPGLRRTGWGILEARDNRLKHLANGTIKPPTDLPMAERLAFLHRELTAVIDVQEPDTAAVEAVFVHKNAESALKLGQARGVAMVALALREIEVAEYAANAIKKSVVGAGHASKDQIGMMVQTLLPGAQPESADAADALAAAICHAHHQETAARIALQVAAR